jgi:Mg2+/Co2+ transporter CorB
VIALQAQSADFFAASQIGLNAIAILGGNQSRFQLNESSIRTVLINEYALVVAVVTLSDIMVTVTGKWGAPREADQQAMQREDGSWLIDGGMPVADMKRLPRRRPAS